MAFPVTEHVVETDRHRTFYLACGAEDGPLIVFVHGWPELSVSWRHQLPCFASLGFRAIAPDMRGYGRSSVYARHEDYALEHSVADMQPFSVVASTFSDGERTGAVGIIGPTRMRYQRAISVVDSMSAAMSRVWEEK